MRDGPRTVGKGVGNAYCRGASNINASPRGHTQSGDFAPVQRRFRGLARRWAQTIVTETIQHTDVVRG